MAPFPVETVEHPGPTASRYGRCPRSRGPPDQRLRARPAGARAEPGDREPPRPRRPPPGPGRVTTLCTRRSLKAPQPNWRRHPPGHRPPVGTAVTAVHEAVHGGAVAVEHRCSGLTPVLVGPLPSRLNSFVVIGNASV